MMTLLRKLRHVCAQMLPQLLNNIKKFISKSLNDVFCVSLNTGAFMKLSAPRGPRARLWLSFLLRFSFAFFSIKDFLYPNSFLRWPNVKRLNCVAVARLAEVVSTLLFSAFPDDFIYFPSPVLTLFRLFVVLPFALCRCVVFLFTEGKNVSWLIILVNSNQTLVSCTSAFTWISNKWVTVVEISKYLIFIHWLFAWKKILTESPMMIFVFVHNQINLRGILLRRVSFQNVSHPFQESKSSQLINYLKYSGSDEMLRLSLISLSV